MSSRNIRDPPPMSEPYAEWKNEILIWSDYIQDKTPLEKQGLALFLSLDGDARKAAAKVTLPEMKKTDGLQRVIKELDKFYLKDADREAFLAYDRFHSFIRPTGMSIKEFLIKFELMRNACISHNVEIADKIVAHHMLRTVNIPPMKQELVKTTLTTFSADNMRNQILKIFSEDMIPETSNSVAGCSSSSSDNFQVKTEDVNEDVNFTLYGSRSAGYNRNRNFRSNRNQSSSNSDEPKRNPVDEYGNVRTCDFCKSIYHYTPKCPDKPMKKKNQRSRGGYYKNPSL